MPGTIKFLGGVALLVSGLTGPSIAVSPQLFQQAGWFTPVMAFLLTTVFVGSASLFLVESMASIAGNEGFQASIEFSTLAELFLGNRWHWAFQIILYIALHSQTITSLIESFQSMDTLLVTIAHKSCAISFQKGWECVDTLLPNGAGVFSDYIFLSFGYLMTFVLVLPLGLIHLSDNIKFQIASLTILFVIVIIWIVTFFQAGITNHPIPTIGSNQGTVVGYVISNFAIVTTIPAFVNNIHPSTNIHRVVWLSLLISCVLYLMIGLTGASAFDTPQNSTILDVISARRPSIIALISVYVFPLAVLITSIPVFMIVIRYNLLRGNICSKPWAIFLSSVLPWIIVIPFQTNGWLTVIMNWASLFFSSTANLIIPFILYLVSKRYHASAVLDIQLDQDEFRLRPLEISSLNNSSVSIHRNSGSPSVVAIHSRSRSQVSHGRHAEDPPVSAIINSTEKLNSPGHFLDAETTTSTSAHPDNTIRLVRSPSVHRYYGEAIEGSSTGHGPRRPSISRSVTPSLAFGRTEHEKVDLKPGTEVEIIFCTITTVMIIVAVVYNIVLTARQKS